MQLRRLRIFFVMSLLLFATPLLLISCSASQQQDDQSMEIGGQSQDEENANQVEGQGESSAIEEENSGENGNYASDGSEEFSLNNQENNLSLNNEGDFLGEESKKSSDESLAAIMNNMTQTELKDSSGGNMEEAEALAVNNNTNFATKSTSQAQIAPVTSAEAGISSGYAGPAAAPGLPEMGSKMSYLVVRGDSLSKISAKIYGNFRRWRELAENSGIDNPEKIYPGDLVYYQLTKQSLAFARTYERTPRHSIAIKTQEILHTIAENVYSPSADRRSIQRQNHHIAKDGLLIKEATAHNSKKTQLFLMHAGKNKRVRYISDTIRKKDLLAKMVNSDSEKESKSQLDRWSGNLFRWDA